MEINLIIIDDPAAAAEPTEEQREKVRKWYDNITLSRRPAGMSQKISEDFVQELLMGIKPVTTL